ncbi:hypothetical protein BaRGS_00015796, partial [Batillaria attramentaria]
ATTATSRQQALGAGTEKRMMAELDAGGRISRKGGDSQPIEDNHSVARPLLPDLDSSDHQGLTAVTNGPYSRQESLRVRPRHGKHGMTVMIEGLCFSSRPAGATRPQRATGFSRTGHFKSN